MASVQSIIETADRAAAAGTRISGFSPIGATDVDEFTHQVRDWHFEFTQLKPGQFAAHGAMAQFDGVSVAHASINRTLVHAGGAPRHMLAILIPGPGSGQVFERTFPAPLSLNALSRHCGVAQRTLEYGFRQVYGTTPLTYVRSQRLTRNRLALLSATAPTSVSETAKAHGFTHMGQYSRDYRRTFGETPSARLARGRSASTLPALA